MSWGKVKVGDCCEVTSSKRIFFSEYVDSGVPFYRSKEIIESSNGQAISEPLFISQEKYDEIKNHFGVPQPGDMLLTSVGTIGVPYIVREKDYFYFKDGNLTWFRNFSDELDSKYLYFWLKSSEGQSVLNNTTIGSSQKALTIASLKGLEIPCPPAPVQKRIVEILAGYDDLIENNQKQIKLFEEAAQRLYKEWFVDLRFPGHETTPIVDGVPEGWRSLYLQEIVGYEIGGGWGEETPTEKCDYPAYVIRGTDLSGITHGSALTIPFRYHSKHNLDARTLTDGDIVFEVSGGSKTEGVARTALIRSAMLELWQYPVMCASFCKLIRAKNTKHSQVLFDAFRYMRASGKTSEYDKKSASSIVNYRWKDFLSNESILMPTDELLEIYNSIVGNMYQMIVQKSITIEKAKEARDRLLPKLMSGEIEV